MVSYSRTWFAAWAESAYGPAGFWPGAQPRDHFRTAARDPVALVALVGALLDQQPGLQALVEVGAGGGELLTELARRRPGLRLTGIDLRPRPAGLAAGVEWVMGTWDVFTHRWSEPASTALAGLDRPTMVVAHEWLDDLPCRVVRRGPDGWLELVDPPAGHVGPALDAESRAWAAQWWPVGERAEIGLTRDRAWAALVDAVAPTGGSALMIDYGHQLDTRPELGTLAAYRDGRAVEPRPRPDTNLTAHVAVDAVRSAGEARGARTVLLARQAAVVARLRPPRPALTDPLADLSRRSQWDALQSRAIWGSFWWLLQHFGSVEL